MEPPTLFDITDTPTPDTPPAAWVTHHGLTGYRYGCRCTTCTQAKKDRSTLDSQGQRRCQHCGTTYPKTTGGGTKFCADCIRNDVYLRNWPKKIQPTSTCARCSGTYQGRTTSPWKLCQTCAGHPVHQLMASSLGNHHATIDLVLAVMDWPYCANEECGAFLLQQVDAERTNAWGTRRRSNYCIDHDHTCCPGSASSCGQCIRGIVCRRCNRMLLASNPDTYSGLEQYLDRYRG